jgi:hypothetical protein
MTIARNAIEETAAKLKHRLRKAVAAARGKARNPRRLRMKDSRPKSDQRRSNQNNSVMMRGAEQQQAEEGKSHANGERERLRPLIGEMTDDRLQQRGGELERQRDHADLREVERVIVFQDRIDRRDQRLHGVVEKMRKADCRQHDISRSRPGRLGGGIGRQLRRDHRCDQRFFGDDDRLVQCMIPGGRFAVDTRFLRRERRGHQHH